MNSLLVDIPIATKQAAGRVGIPAYFLVHVSKSNYNNLERASRNLRLQLGVKYDATSVQVSRVLVVIV